MSRAVTKRQQKITYAAREVRAPEPVARRLTQIAFVLTLVLVITRMTMPDALRNPWMPMPGSEAVTKEAGPATSLALDLICCLPALLVLVRRVFDERFRVRLGWANGVLFALAAWALISVAWASDRFASLVNAFHWTTAAVLLWSTAQLVCSAPRLRVVAAVSVGLLGVLLVQGYYYRFVDLPDLQQHWQEHRAEMLAGQGTSASSAEVTQIGKNIESGVPTGFNLSRNTYAAVLVLLMVIAAGVVLQRIADRDRPGFWVPIAVLIALGLFMLYRYVQSKTAYATPIFAAGLLALFWTRRDWLAARAKRVYWGAVAAFALLVAAVVGHGLKHGTLFHSSLTFRWQYWVGAARIFVRHPLLGTGWADFGSWYTAYRLPQAAEEPTDPHNFLLKAFVELGTFGGILMIAWILRLWWEWTVAVPAGSTPAPSGATHATTDRAAGLGQSAKDKSTRESSAFPFLITLSILAIAFSAAVSIDWTSQSALIILEVFKRLLFLIAMLIGTCLVGVHSMDRQVLDDRPAPWILIASLVGLGLFLLHNLIDFSIFETGPMFLFALLAGTALGVRRPAEPGQSPNARAAFIGLAAVAGIAWLVALGMLWLPVAEAESLAQDADEQVRTSRDAKSQLPPDAAAIDRASRKLTDAFRLVPYNADYAFRAEQVLLLVPNPNLPALRQLLDKAIAADPRRVRYLSARAILDTSTGDFPAARHDYERILQLDPHNLELRTQYADLLERMGQRAQAAEQYREVLAFNDLLDKAEIRRLPPRQEAALRAKLAADSTTRPAR